MTEITKFYDCFGQEIEGQTCGYCQQTKPVKVFATSAGGVETNPLAYDVLMRQITIDDELLSSCITGPFQYILNESIIFSTIGR